MVPNIASAVSLSTCALATIGTHRRVAAAATAANAAVAAARARRDATPPNAPARETELIDLIKSYQAIANAPDRTLVRKLLKRLSASTGRTRTASP